MGGHDPSKNNICRHYVVMSTSDYNHATNMFIGLPITTSDYSNNPKYMPISVNGSNGYGVKGYIVLWQLQNFDFVARHGKVINHLDQKKIDQLQVYVNDMVGSE